MYKKIAALSFCAAVLFPFIVFSQDTLVKQLSPFTSINITDKGKVIVTQDAVHTLRVEPADKGENVKATVKDNTLSIDAPSGVTLYVSMKEIHELSISGSGSITSETPLKSEDLSLSIGGSGKIDIEQADVKKLTTDISGMGRITVSGKAETTNMRIAGSGKIDAAGLKTATCNVSIAGLGKCLVDVTDHLNVTITGSGSVNYITPPKNISKSISGSGKVREADSGTDNSDTTSVRFGNKKIIISDGDEKDNDREQWERRWEEWGYEWRNNSPFSEKKKKKISGRNKPSWPGIELGVNGYLDAGYSTTLPQGLQYMDLDYGKSIAFSINFFAARKHFFDRHLFLFTGLGVTWNNYHFDNNITLQPGSTTVLASFDSISYSKNKITASYLIAPAMVEYFFGDRRYKSVHISGGMILGYKLGSHTKQKYDLGGGTAKTKVYDDFNLNPFRASMRVSLGYGMVNIFAERALTTFFEKDKGPILYPFTAGIGISSFL